MTKTGTQNRPYTDERLMVHATFRRPGQHETVMDFNWNDREHVRKFAGISDEVIRSGGSTVLESRQP